MTESKYPAGWDAERVRRLIDHYEGMSDDELAAEDDAAAEDRPGQTVVTVPSELLPAIRQLLASHKSAGPGAAPDPAPKAGPGE
jgi:hypothetical protein